MHNLSLAWSKLRLCSANHRAGYFSNLACDWLSIGWAYPEQETGNGLWSSHLHNEISCTGKNTSFHQNGLLRCKWSTISTQLMYLNHRCTDGKINDFKTKCITWRNINWCTEYVKNWGKISSSVLLTIYWTEEKSQASCHLGYTQVLPIQSLVLPSWPIYASLQQTNTNL